jgi:fatty acid desaturase
VTVYREGSEIRIERSEEKARQIAGACFLVPALVAVWGLFVADELRDWLFLAGFIGLGIHLGRHNLRHRDICIIRPDQVGYTVAGEMRWIDRAPLAFVQVIETLIVQVVFFDVQGKTRESFTLGNFDVGELREAFEEAGIPSRQRRRPLA